MSSSGIIKTDSRGRVRYSEERRQEILNEFEQSGLSSRRFAAIANIKYQTLSRWVTDRKKRTVPSPAVAPPTTRWLEAVVEKAGISHAPSTGLTICLPGGGQAQVADAAQARLAAMVLRSLEHLPSRPC